MMTRHYKVVDVFIDVFTPCLKDNLTQLGASLFRKR